MCIVLNPINPMRCFLLACVITLISRYLHVFETLFVPGNVTSLYMPHHVDNGVTFEYLNRGIVAQK